ncbi:DUF2829 domain-containing protein [Novosphingobium sp. NBM11]|uniref:DUF2829 domain-containing protein n=1 Tax=Novosphingobium sp. NBM11 TaxID=2596914 RepID=UPI0018920698|nr:DUF2829 domain-containing protein [Novosphingobium sp. NBM11]MBF5091938.1 DUF2829 domain-containing protein [Novosphingobium sp. NBM11]
MEKFIGTKLVLAKPMTRGEYNAYRQWDIPADEDPKESGFLVEYLDGGKPNDIRHKGYISWSPLDVFVKAYRPANGMTFGQALEAIKAGHAVARAGWNGKRMFVFLNRGSVCGDSIADVIDGIHRSMFDDGDTGTTTRLPNINMRAASGAIVTGWLASQTDMLAEDWAVVETEAGQ